LIDSIEFYDEDESKKILTEKNDEEYNLEQWVSEELPDVKQTTQYYLFMKPPQQPKVKVDEVHTGDSQEKRVKKHLKSILMDADFITQFKPSIKDKNSISSILQVLRQHIEKKKVFGESNAQDFKYVFVINSIKSHFDVHRNLAREVFHKFVKMCINDQV